MAWGLDGRLHRQTDRYRGPHCAAPFDVRRGRAGRLWPWRLTASRASTRWVSACVGASAYRVKKTRKRVRASVDVLVPTKSRVYGEKKERPATGKRIRPKKKARCLCVAHSFFFFLEILQRCQLDGSLQSARFFPVVAVVAAVKSGSNAPREKTARWRDIKKEMIVALFALWCLPPLSGAFLCRADHQLVLPTEPYEDQDPAIGRVVVADWRKSENKKITFGQKRKRPIRTEGSSHSAPPSPDRHR